MDEKINEVRAAFYEAKDCIEYGNVDEALAVLAYARDEVEAFSLPDDCVWTDYERFLDGMIYNDYYAKEIDGREIRRHPMQPGQMLYLYGSLLIEANRPGDALEPLTLLVSLDPVSPKYLFELGEAYKRTGDFEKAYDLAKTACSFAANDRELARCYRDLGFCLSEQKDYENAAALYLLSLDYADTKQAKSELGWLSQNHGITLYDYGEDTVQHRCEALDIPVGISQLVKNNLALMELLREDGVAFVNQMNDNPASNL